MREITDRKQVEAWLREGNIPDQFDTPGLPFRAYRYEKGELIVTPSRPMRHLLFLVAGRVLIYGIRRDGGMAPVDELDRRRCWAIWNTAAAAIRRFTRRRRPRRRSSRCRRTHAVRCWIATCAFCTCFCAPTRRS